MQRISPRFYTLLLAWLPSAFVLTLAIFAAYATGQQVMRMSANDPQIQLAEDVATALRAGKMPEDIVPSSSPFALENSLSTFVVITRENGTPDASNARLGKDLPTLPSGVLTEAKMQGRNVVTWEPQSGLRFATVTVPYVAPSGTAGYVTSGRSLREVESRYASLAQAALMTWLFGVIVLAAFFWTTKTATRTA